MYCRFCGNSIANDSDFCTYCGRLLGTSSTAPKMAETAIPIKPQKRYHHTKTDLFMMAFCYLALGVFLFLNIKMAPFYGWLKFLAYIVEAAVAIFLTWFTKEKLEGFCTHKIKICSIVLSILVIISSVGLRIVYENKVEIAEADIPKSGTVLVSIRRDVEHSSYAGGWIRDPETTIKVNGQSGKAEITFGEPFTLEINTSGSNLRDSSKETLTLNSSHFKKGTYQFTRTLRLGYINVKVDITMKRICTFWDVIFY